MTPLNLRLSHLTTWLNLSHYFNYKSDDHRVMLTDKNDKLQLLMYNITVELDENFVHV